MKLLPRHWPGWRVHGAKPSRAAILRRSSEPSSGSSSISVRAMIRPTPGTEASRSSLSAQTGEPALIVDLAVVFGQFLLHVLAQPRDAFLHPFVASDARSSSPSAAIISTICRRRATRSASSLGLIWQRPKLRPCSLRRSERSRAHRSHRSWLACRAPELRPAPAPQVGTVHAATSRRGLRRVLSDVKMADR